MSKLLANAWGVLSQKDDERTQVAFAIAVIFWVAFAGAFAAFAFGFSARQSGFWSSLSGGFIATLSCVGAFAAGGMLGLLFGSPTTGSATSAGNGSEGKQGGIGVRPNTSLERVADWLTTMIVGLGLVNLRPIMTEATAMSVWLTQAITGANTPNGTPGAAIALAYSFAGFALVYLWSMRFLPNELRASYDDIKQRLDTVEEEKEALLKFKKTAVFSVQEGTLTQIRERLTAAGIPNETVADVVARYKVNRTADAEPMFEFGPAEGEGYKLTAVVADLGSRKFQISVNVSAPGADAAGNVFWLLHNSFAPDVLSECPIEQNYMSIVDEPFWVGALVPRREGAPVKLAIDLGSIEGNPPNFKTL